MSELCAKTDPCEQGLHVCVCRCVCAHVLTHACTCGGHKMTWPAFLYCSCFSSFNLKSVYMCVCARVCMRDGAAHMWRSENIQASVLLFYHVGAEDEAQTLGFGSKDLYPLNHLMSLSALSSETEFLTEPRSHLFCYTYGSKPHGIHPWLPHPNAGITEMHLHTRL